MFDGRFRAGVDRVTRPVASALRATRVAPDHLTALGLVLAAPAAWAIATGRLGLGLGLLIGSAVPDLLDGPLAKATGKTSVRGAFFDSVADRVNDALVLGALAWYLQDTHRGHVDMLPVAVLGVSLIISYERAKAESLGFTAKGGLMERAERIVVTCAALAFSFVMVPLLWAMLVLSAATAVQRFVAVWRQANASGQRPPRSLGRRRAGFESLPVSARWRAWREASGWAQRARSGAPRAGSGAAASRSGGSRSGVGRSSASARWHELRRHRASSRRP